MQESDRLAVWLTERGKSLFPDAPPQQWRFSCYFQMLQSLGQAFIEQPDNPTGQTLEDFLWRAESVVDTICIAANGWEGRLNLAVWRHDAVSLDAVKRGTQRYVDKDAVQGAVAEYLDLPVRSALIDRCLVDLLIFSEFAGYAKDVHLGFPGAGFRKGNGPLGWLIGRLLSALVLLLPAYLIAVSFEGEWADWVAMGLSTIFILESIWSIVMFPFAWRGQISHNAKVLTLLKTMNGVYSELNGEWSVSAGHIRDVAQKATTEGVVWPSSLFVLLDDILARGGRF